MSRTVFCKKYQQDLPGLEKPPFPGPKGQELFEHISARAWDDWQAHQTMLINERRLNMMEPGSRAFLSEERDKFMANEDVAQAEGFVPVDESDGSSPAEGSQPAEGSSPNKQDDQ